MTALTPVKASLVADLVDLINENLGALLVVRTVCCPDCGGRGTVGGATVYDGGHGGPLRGSHVEDDGTLATCATCGGVGAVERYELDFEKLQQPRYGRHVEQFEYKQGQYVPKFRSKDKAFALLVKILGFDKAVLEIAGGAPFADTLSIEQRAQYVEQLKEMASMGLLDAAA